ncbi:MAG: LrgB family protein [Rikenellaceae bacterium]
MEQIVDSAHFIIALNLAAYILSGVALKMLGIKFMNALLPAILIVVGAVLLLDIEYERYAEHSQMITIFLSPSVVALGYLLHKQVDKIKANLMPILISVSVGAIVNLLTINLILKLFGTDITIIYSIQPKSVTTAIALSLSTLSGGIPSLTVIAVVIAGVVGSVMGPTLLKLSGINNPISVGLAMGSSAHAVGTARAMELGALQGAMSGLAIGVMGLITSLLITFCRDILL